VFPGIAFAFSRDVGMGRGYLEGLGGWGTRPELLVNGWVAKGSKDFKDMAL